LAVGDGFGRGPGAIGVADCQAGKGSNTQMHIHRCMGSKTISLEDSAYERLLAAKRPGESFSDVVHRVLGGHDPSFLDFQGLVDRKSADRLAEAIAQMRREDIREQRKRSSRRR